MNYNSVARKRSGKCLAKLIIFRVAEILKPSKYQENSLSVKAKVLRLDKCVERIRLTIKSVLKKLIGG